MRSYWNCIDSVLIQFRLLTPIAWPCLVHSKLTKPMDPRTYSDWTRCIITQLLLSWMERRIWININRVNFPVLLWFPFIIIYPFISSETSRSPAWDYLRKYLVSDCPKDVTMISSCSVEPCHSGPCFEINSAFWTGDPLQHLTTSYNILQGGKALFLGGCIFIFSRLPGNSRKIWYSQRFNASAILTESNRISHFWVASNIRCDERVEGHASSICSEGRLLRDSEGIRNKYSRQPIISHTEWMRAAHAVKLDGQTILMGMWQRIVRMTAFRRYKIYLNLTLTKCWTVLKVTY